MPAPARHPRRLHSVRRGQRRGMDCSRRSSPFSGAGVLMALPVQLVLRSLMTAPVRLLTVLPLIPHLIDLLPAITVQL